jgi:hypothetical protein
MSTEDYSAIALTDRQLLYRKGSMKVSVTVEH